MRSLLAHCKQAALSSLLFSSGESSLTGEFVNQAAVNKGEKEKQSAAAAAAVECQSRRVVVSVCDYPPHTHTS